MLRASVKEHDEAIDLRVVMDGVYHGDIEHGELLVDMAEVVVGADDATIKNARDALLAAMGVEAMVDAAGVASNFERMVRIADATGITLGKSAVATERVRKELDINR